MISTIQNEEMNANEVREEGSAINSDSTFFLRLKHLSKFYAKVAAFLFCSAIFMGPILNQIVPEQLVYRKTDTFVSDSLKKSKEPSNASVLIVGDSVGRQLFDGYPDHKTVFLWQSASLLGQYIVIKNSLEADPGKIKKVVLVIVPHTLMNDLDQPFTYLDIVRTLYSRETKADFDKVSNEALFRFLPARLAQFSLFRMTDLVFFDYSVFNPNRFTFDPYTKLTPYLSKVSKVQLLRIRRLCSKHGVTLVIAPCPIIDSTGSDMTRLRRDIKEAGLSSIFKGFFEKLQILPQNSFRDDQIHLSDPFLKDNMEKVKAVIYKGN